MTIRYWTLVFYNFARSKEGRAKYRRVDGKILLFSSWHAANIYRQEIGSAAYVHPVDIGKLRKDHRLMGGSPFQATEGAQQ